MTNAGQVSVATTAIDRPPGFLLNPLKWAALPMMALLQNQPLYLADLIHLTRTRMHLIGIALAHVGGGRSAELAELERQVLAWHNNNPVSQRLATIPGIGPIIATAIAATVADPSIFRSGREFAAWLGLVPRQNSTGGKARLGGISKRGDSYLRRLLVNSAHTVLLCSKQAKTDPWLTSLLSRKPRLVVAVALANKTARMAWAIMNGQDTYRRAPLAA